MTFKRFAARSCGWTIILAIWAIALGLLLWLLQGVYLLAVYAYHNPKASFMACCFLALAVVVSFVDELWKWSRHNWNHPNPPENKHA